MPLNKKLVLPNPDNLKAQYFFKRIEIRIINVRGKGIVTYDSEQFKIDYNKTLYLGKGNKEVFF